MKRCSKVFLVAVIVTSMCLPALIVRSEEVTCKGRYVMGDMDTRKDARSFALMEAKRMAIEKGGTYLESSSEVRNYQLTKDQINSLAAGILSVEVIDESWQTSGETMAVIVTIRAIVDTANLHKRIAALRESDDQVAEVKNIQSQLAALKQELDALKARRESAGSGGDDEASRSEQKSKYSNLTTKLELLEQLEKAEAELATGDNEKAAESYEKIISANPETAEAYTGMAIAKMRKGDFRDALGNVEQAIQRDSDSSKAYAVKSRIHSHLRENDAALEEINKALELNPDNPKLFFLRGNIYLNMKKGKLGIKDLKRSCGMGYRQACVKVKSLIQKRIMKQ